jgi:EF hand
MVHTTLRLTFGLTAALVIAAVVTAQPPGRRGGPPGPKGPPGGPGGGLERIVDDLNIPESKRDTALEAVRVHQADLRRLNDLARSDLLITMKDVLSDEQFRSFRSAIEPGPGLGGRGGRGLGVDAMVERIMSFDKNNDGKVTKDELPERMHDLITKGDRNKDGALDREEIKKLAADQPRDDDLVGRGPRGPGPGGRGGPKGKGGPKGRGGPPGGPPPFVIDEAVADLKLADAKKEAATAAVRAHHETVRKLTDLARADLLLHMQDILNADEFKEFKVAFDRRPPRPRP